MNTSQDKAKLLEDRTIKFSLEVIKLCRKVPKTQENLVITNQLVRSATSIGANYAEANDAMSRQDFRNKIFIAKKEAAESRYWLRLLSELNPEVDISWLKDEVQQLIFILQKIVSTLKNGK